MNSIKFSIKTISLKGQIIQKILTALLRILRCFLNEFLSKVDICND